MRRLGRTLSAFFILVVAVIVAGVAVLKSLDFNEFRGVIEREVEAATGRAFTIGGRLELALTLVPTLKVDDVSIANAKWGSRPKMARLGKLEIEVDLLPLFSRELRVNRLILREVDILLETDAMGHANWEVAEVSGAAGAQSGASDTNTVLPTVKNVLIRNARVVYRDGRTGRATKLDLDQLNLKSDDSTRPIQFRTRGRLDNDLFVAAGQIGSLASLMSGEGPFPLSFDGNALGARVRVNGKIDDLSEAKGLDIEVEARIDDWSRVRQVLPDPSILPSLPPIRLSGRVQGSDRGFKFTALSLRAGESDVAGRIAVDLVPHGFRIDADLTSERIDLQPFIFPLMANAGEPSLGEPWSLDGLRSLDAKVSLRVKRIETGMQPLDDLQVIAVIKDGHLALNDLRVKSAGSDFAGHVSVTPGKSRPQIVAALMSKRLDLAPLLAFNRGEIRETPAKWAEAADKGVKVFSSEPIDLDGMRMVDADLSIEIGRIDSDGGPIKSLDAKATLTDGRLEVAFRSFRVAGGDVSVYGSVVAEPASRPTVTLRVEAKGVNSGTLLKAWGITDSVEGAVLQANIDLAGRGRSPAAIMATLNGKGIVTFGEARISNDAVMFAGADLTQRMFNALNPFAKEKLYTPLRCGVVHFAARDGKVWADQGIGVQTDRINVVGSGSIDLSTEKLEFAAKAEARKELGISFGSIASLAMVGGTLAEPQSKFDKLSALGSAASVGVAVATFGLSILAKRLWKKVNGDVSPCTVARDSVLIPDGGPAEGMGDPDGPAQRREKAGGGILRKLGKGAGDLFGKFPGEK